MIGMNDVAMRYARMYSTVLCGSLQALDLSQLLRTEVRVAGCCCLSLYLPFSNKSVDSFDAGNQFSAILDVQSLTDSGCTLRGAAGSAQRIRIRFNNFHGNANTLKVSSAA